MNIKKIKTLGIITARKGSKGVPNKNFKIIKNKKRLIDYTIMESKKSKYISKIAVSTDDDRIISHIKKYKIDYIIKRKKNLSTNSSKSIDVVIDVIKRLKNLELDLVILLQPTSPLRKSFHIDNAIKLLCKKYKKYDSLVSISSIEEPHPLKLKKIEKGYLESFIKGSNSEIPRQSLKKIYKLNGAIYLIKKKTLMKKKTFFSKTLPFKMDQKYSLNIDTMSDLKTLQNR